MEIRVSGHQIETGEALQAHVSDRMNAIADKYFSRAIGAHATFGKGPHDSFQCDIVAHVMQGLVLKGHGQAQDAHVAFEGAAERIEKQLRRYMRRLKDHNNGVAALSRRSTRSRTMRATPCSTPVAKRMRATRPRSSPKRASIFRAAACPTR